MHDLLGVTDRNSGGSLEKKDALKSSQHGLFDEDVAEKTYDHDADDGREDKENPVRSGGSGRVKFEEDSPFVFEGERGYEVAGVGGVAEHDPPLAEKAAHGRRPKDQASDEKGRADSPGANAAKGALIFHDHLAAVGQGLGADLQRGSDAEQS
jgi:hypothetical protein